MRFPLPTLRFWRRRQAWRAAAQADATALIDQFGGRAYEEARRRALEARSGRLVEGSRPTGHWDQVRAEIGRRTGHNNRLDTATRYVSP